MNTNIFEELKTVLLTYTMPSEYFENIKNTVKLYEQYPELNSLINLKQNENYHKEGDVWTHTMMVTDCAARRREQTSFPLGFMLSALCHDFGKAIVTTETDGVIHAYAHEVAGLPVAEKFLLRLGADREIISYVLNMVELHMEPNIMANARSKIKSTNRLFDKSCAPADLIQLAICDGLGKIPVSEGNEKFLSERLKIFEEIMERPFITEKDLLDYGIKDDKYFEEIFRHSHKLRLAGIKKDSALLQTLAFARKLKGVKNNDT